MKYVNKVTGRDGVCRLYFRKKGHVADGAALTSPWPDIAAGSALEREVGQLLGIEVVRATPRNLAGALRAYELGADFANALAASTQREYRYLLGELETDFGALPVSAFTSAYLLQLRDLWAARGHRAANLRMQVLKNALTPVLIALDAPDPFARVPSVRRPRDAAAAHQIWPERVVETVIETAIGLGKPGLARAVAIGRYAGARRGDIVRMLQTARADGRIVWLSGKRRVPVNQPEDPALTRWLDATPAMQPLSKWQAHVQRKTGVFRLPPNTLVFNIANRPYTEDGLGQELAKITASLSEAGKIEHPNFDLHGLRHSFGVEAALAGCTDAQGAALLGHGSAHSFAQYRRQADRLRMADDGAALIAALRDRAPAKRAAAPAPPENITQLRPRA